MSQHAQYLIAIILAITLLAGYAWIDNSEWEAFKAANKCEPIATETSHALPALNRITWRCADGKEYVR